MDPITTLINDATQNGQGQEHTLQMGHIPEMYLSELTRKNNYVTQTETSQYKINLNKKSTNSEAQEISATIPRSAHVSQAHNQANNAQYEKLVSKHTQNAAKPANCQQAQSNMKNSSNLSKSNYKQDPYEARKQLPQQKLIKPQLRQTRDDNGQVTELTKLGKKTQTRAFKDETHGKHLSFAGQNTCINGKVTAYVDSRNVRKSDLETLKVKVELPELTRLVILLALVLINHFENLKSRLISKMLNVATDAKSKYNQLRISTRKLANSALEPYTIKTGYHIDGDQVLEANSRFTIQSPLIAEYSSTDVTIDGIVECVTEEESEAQTETIYDLGNLFRSEGERKKEIPLEVTIDAKTIRNKSISLMTKYKTSRDTIAIGIGTQKPEFLIDSGADISLIKQAFAPELGINSNDITSLTGIGKGEIRTLGSLRLSMNFKSNLKIDHTIHVVGNDFPIEEDGILGRDFFNKHSVDIRYSNNELGIAGHSVKFTNETRSHIVLPARSETVIEIGTPTNDLMICLATEIRTGIYTPHTLIQPIDNKASILVANTLERDEIITNFKPQVEQLNATVLSNIAYQRHPEREEQIVQLLAENLDTNNNTEENMSVLSLCMEYSDIFFIEGDRLTNIDGVQHDINLYTDTKPVHTQRYRLPQNHKEELNKQVQEMLDEGRIQRSISPYSSPLLVVPKKPGKDGQPKWRVVVDFRKLNEVTIGDSFPLPNINDILDQLGHAQYFSTLDLASGYHQIQMNPRDAHKTAFSTDYGHFEFTRMPFGLKNSQATFQRAINNILRGFQGIKGFVYLDDVIIYGKNLREHNAKLAEVFDICRLSNLKLQCTKCQFLRKEITFLGHLITPAGIKPNPTTVEAVHKFPNPRNKREVQSFLGLANYYRRFIPRFSEIAEPLNKLTRKRVTFEFTEECKTALEKLKQSLIEPPVLKYPDLNRPFILTTDASDYSLGAILSQVYSQGEFPIAYASRSLGKSERNYSVIEKEMLAIYWAVNNFRPYLYGRKFTVVTDHKPLVGNLTKVPNRILKWNLKLSEYNYDMVHKSGKQNTNADALSRIRHDVILVTTRAQARNEELRMLEGQNPTKTVTVETEKIESKTSNELREVISSAKPYKTSTSVGNQFSKESGLEKFNPGEQDTIPTVGTERTKVEVVHDHTKRWQILNEYHNLPLGGHAGTWRTYKRIKMLYYWPNMLTDINRYIRKCQLCKRNKSHLKTKAPLQITSTSTHPFQRVAFDIVGPLPKTENNNQYLLTFQDDLSKLSGAIPITDQSANTVARALCEHYITKYGIPEKILTDQGSNFMSKSFNEVCKLLKLKHLTTTAYHPETNGALEKSHNTLKEYLRSFTDIDRNNWDAMCHYAIFVYNTTPHCATNYTPHELVYGRPALIPSAVRKEPEPVYSYDDYIHELKARLRLAHAVARERLIKQKHITKQRYDQKIRDINLQLGDDVWLRNDMRKNKQDPLWLGPYKVVELNSPVNTTIQIRNRMVRVHNNRLHK